MYKGVLEHQGDELNEHRNKTKGIPQKQVIVPILKPSVNNLDNDETKQLESWFGIKKWIMFDSDVDNWNINTSVVDQKVINKSNLIF